jgi:aminoglycoside 3-N-acetyltransferase I
MPVQRIRIHAVRSRTVVDSSVQSSRDWLASAPASTLAWWLPYAAIVTSLSAPVPIRASVWTMALIWAGTACILNARRCRRFAFLPPCNKGCRLVDARTRPPEPVLQQSYEGSAFKAATPFTSDGLEMSIAPQYTYRQLTSDDVTLLKELLRIFGHAFNDSETYQRAIPSDEYLTNLLRKKHFIVVVAMKEKAIIGGLAAYVLEKFEQTRREIYIYDLAVSDAHRRKGVATGTINALRKIAACQGAYVIFVQADLEDDPATALYRSLGTMKTAHHFDIEVGTTNSETG